MAHPTRRQFLKAAGKAAALLPLPALAQGSSGRVVVIGGGFAGATCARFVKRMDPRVTVTLVEASRTFTACPFSNSVIAGLRDLTAQQFGYDKTAASGVAINFATATAVDTQARTVILSDGVLDYDTLIVATGATHQYFGHDEWEQFAPGLKNLDDATAMRGRILLAFEAAERERHPEKLQAWMTFVIVGAGPTGAELAGALGEIAHDTLRHDFRAIDPSQTRIILVEGTDRALPAYPPKLSEAARRMLERLGVTVRTGAMVTDIRADGVTIRCGNRDEIIPTRTVLWAAGVLASPLGVILSQEAGAKLDRACRVIVEPDMSIAAHPEIFVIGDLSNFSHQTGQPLPGVAQPAIQQGNYVAKLIRARLRGDKLPPFHYFDKGNLATIGRGAAVADLNWLRLSGWPAWLMWVFIHLVYIIQFQNRLLVMLQWAWLYITFDRSARLITGKNPLPLDL